MRRRCGKHVANRQSAHTRDTTSRTRASIAPMSSRLASVALSSCLSCSAMSRCVPKGGRGKGSCLTALIDIESNAVPPLPTTLSSELLSAKNAKSWPPSR